MKIQDLEMHPFSPKRDISKPECLQSVLIWENCEILLMIQLPNFEIPVWPHQVSQLFIHSFLRNFTFKNSQQTCSCSLLGFGFRNVERVKSLSRDTPLLAAPGVYWRVVATLVV
jgi:hypothetical protein